MSTLHHWWNWFRTIKYRWAYRTMVKTMRDDPAFAETWQANMAMPIYDAFRPIVSAEDANKCADQLMRHLFEYRKP